MKKLRQKLNIVFGLAAFVLLALALNSPLAAKAGVIAYVQDENGNSKGEIINNGNGTVTINYTNETTLRMKVLVQSTDASYNQQYDYTSNTITLPLSGGDISYVIKLCRNIEGTRYSVICKGELTCSEGETRNVFLYTNAIVKYRISDEVVKRAAELTQSCKTEREVIQTVHKYIVENFTYNKELSTNINNGTVKVYYPDIQQVYQTRKAICYDYSVMMAAMLRTRGIEVRVVTGKPDPSMINGYHAWLQVYDAEASSWITIDPTYDSTYYRNGLSYKMQKDPSLYSNIVYIY